MTLACALLTSAHVSDSLRTEKRGNQWFVIHQVESGETLFSLSRRYKSALDKIISQNNIEDNAIDIGQVLEIPIASPNKTPTQQAISGKTHTVRTGETLFALSRKYGLTVADIKAWNALPSDQLAVGQVLLLQPPKKSAPPDEPTNIIKVKNTLPTVTKPPFEGAVAYNVVAGDGLALVGRKLKVSIDSLRNWNGLASNNLTIGQTLWYRKYDRQVSKTSDKEEVFGKVRSEGLAKQIENLEGTTKYLALHRSLPVGSLVEVTNLMNKRKVFVRVVGKLPDNSANEGVLIRLTPISFKRLGIIDDRARVELAYYND